MLWAAFEQWPEATFSAEDLVVACWRKFSNDFGLQGYEAEYPDSNVVYRHIMGQSSIVKKQKWLLHVGKKTFKLSNTGVHHSLNLAESMGEDGENTEQRVRIERSRETVLARLLRSRAWHKFQDDGEIVFREACAFWGITLRSSGEDYRYARDELNASLSLAEERLSGAHNGALYVGEPHTEIHANDIARLRHLDLQMESEFAEELAGIKSRIVDRGKIRRN